MAGGEHDPHVVLWRALFVAMTRSFNQIEGRVKPAVDLTLLDLGILFSLNGTGPQPMGSLAALFGVDPSVITYRVGRMERTGYVERGLAENDRRVTNAAITRAGRDALRSGRSVMLEAAGEHFFAYVDPADLPTLTRVFRGLAAERRPDADG